MMPVKSVRGTLAVNNLGKDHSDKPHQIQPQLYNIRNRIIILWSKDNVFDRGVCRCAIYY